MNLFEVITEQLKANPALAFGFERQKDGGLYMVLPGKRHWYFDAEGKLTDTKDLTAAASRRPYAPGYTKPE